MLPPPDACSLAVAAAAALGIDLVAVDLLTTEQGSTVLELNGCADFTDEYSLADDDVFECAAIALLNLAESGVRDLSIDDGAWKPFSSTPGFGRPSLDWGPPLGR